VAQPLRAEPPGPRGFPLLGSLPKLWADPLQAFADIVRDYGDIVRMRVGTTVFFLNHPDHAKQVLQDRQARYARSFIHRMFKPIGGEGLLTNEGDSWLRQRRLAQPAFHRERLAQLASVMTHHAEIMLERWERSASKGEIVDLSKEMLGLTLATAGKALFGADLTGKADELGPVLRTVLNIVGERVASFISFLAAIPTPQNLRFRRAMRELDRAVQSLIEAKRARPGEQGDVLSMLMAARDEETGEGMSDRQLRDEVVTLLIASHETTAVTLSWIFYLLTRHPEAGNRLHAEVSRTLSGRLPSAEDVRGLPYTSEIIQEALRLYPPGYMLSRTLIEEDDVGGYRFPVGATVMMSPYLLHRLPAFWEAPEEFRPERFAPERAQERHRGVYLPFGAGARQCIGNQFAMMQMTLIVAMVAQRFSVSLAPGHAVVPEAALTLRPKHGVRIRLERRA
jgi:cytochrome P450